MSDSHTSVTPDIALFRGHIEAALAYAGGTHTYDDVVSMVNAGRLQFWPGKDSVIITELLEYPRTLTLHFFLAGGNMAELEAMEPLVCAWGREQGCSSATLTGRKGWERTFLTRKGWKPTLWTMGKSLNE